MKRILLLFGILAFTLSVSAQIKHKPVVSPGKQNIAVNCPATGSSYQTPHFLVKNQDISVKSALTITETPIGGTRYDLQTNRSCANRLYWFPDGTVAGVWTKGQAETAFTDRGTGYNYYDGTNWADPPTARIETKRAGWPNIAPCGPTGEAVLAHDFASPGGLILNKREIKGTGSWSETYPPSPAGSYWLSWPRMVSNGTDHNTLHMIAVTRPSGSGGAVYQGLDGALLYSRSTDGGATWDIADQQLPGMTSEGYLGFGGDSYSLAEPVGSNIAFVYGDEWTDVFLMKSNDNGATWNKTMIYQYPYPKYDEAHTLIIDSITVCDGSINVCLDNSGKAHVFFGLMKVANPDTTDGLYTYYPATDGVVYWNEDMPAFQTLNLDSLWAHDNIVGYVQDANGNDTILDFDGIAAYFLSVSSMPFSCVDADGNIILVYSSIMDNHSTSTQNYRHIWCRFSADGGATWSDFTDLTGSIVHNFHECVFPSLSAYSDNSLHLLYQYDEEPGLAVQGDTDPYTDNTISYMSIPKSDIGLGINKPVMPEDLVSQNFPNPARHSTSIQYTLRSAANVSLQLTNVTGQTVFSKNYGMKGVGTGTLTLDVTSLNQGIYFYTFTLGNHSTTKRMVVE
ncbi:MAG: T9SS type A sorting domain-containing protein [Bacteroidetes bacterium]|nr:T9SS type A sorting domain-containing protein [Bacteroidota bacterium]